MTESMEHPLEKRIVRLELQVSELDKNLAIFSVSQNEFSRALEKFAKTNEQLIDTLTQLRIEINGIEKEVATNAGEIKEANDRIKKVHSKFLENEDKSKVDILLLLKDNFMSVLIIIFLVLNQLGFLTIK